MIRSLRPQEIRAYRPGFATLSDPFLLDHSVSPEGYPGQHFNMPRRRNRRRSSPTSAGNTLTTSPAPSRPETAFSFTTRISNDEIDPRLLTSITDKLRAADLLSRPTKRVFCLRKPPSSEETKASELSSEAMKQTDCAPTTRSIGLRKKTWVWVPLVPTVQPSRTVGADLSYAKAASMSDRSTSDGERSASGGSAASSGIVVRNRKLLASPIARRKGSKADDGFTLVTRSKRRGGGGRSAVGSG